jgi:phosphohistidine phosphatase
MFLYLVRHGDAKREEEDSSRALSEKGVYDVSRIASYISQLNLHVLTIFHSPKLRARQTADILFGYLKPLKGLSEGEGLAPIDSPDIWAVRIRDMHDDAMLVGHLPHLGRLASLLICGQSEKNIIAFRTAGIVCLYRDDAGIWSIEWILTPDIILGEKGIGYTCDSL